MTEKELKKLNCYQLLELLILQTERADKLQEKLQEAEQALQDRALELSRLGSIAEASLQLGGVFRAAQEAAVAALIATLVLPVLQIAGTSMEPGLQDGDIVLLVKKKDLKTGDLCAFYYSNKILIKRVIGVPGDYIWIESDGTVVLNGEPLDEPYISEKVLGECDVEFPYQVPENSYFVMGDKRETSIDSRSSVIGCVAEDQLIGRLICKLWPLSEFSFLQ